MGFQGSNIEIRFLQRISFFNFLIASTVLANIIFHNRKKIVCFNNLCASYRGYLGRRRRYQVAVAEIRERSIKKCTEDRILI